MGMTMAAGRRQSWSNAMAKGWIVSHCAPWGMKNTLVLYLKLMDSVSENKKKEKKIRSERPQDWEDGGEVWIPHYYKILPSSQSLNPVLSDQNSLFLTKRRSNEGLSISVDWLVNLSIMSILKAPGLATVSLCVNFSSCPLFKSWWLGACALKMYSNCFIYWGKCSFSLRWPVDPPAAARYAFLTSHSAGK